MTPRHRASGRRSAETTRGKRSIGARTIRTRLAIILSVPTVLLVVLAAHGVRAQLQVAGQATAAAGNVELVLAAQNLVHSLQRERGLTSGMLGGTAQYRPEVDAQRRTSDQARTALDRLLDEASGEDARAVRTALGRLADLGAVRGAVDAGQMDRTRMLDFYTAAITGLNTAGSGSEAGQHDRTLRRGLEALHLLGDAKEATALERGHMNGVFAQGAFTQDDYVRFTEVRARKLDALNRFSQVSTDRRRAELEGALRTTEATTASAYEQRALAGARGQQLRVGAPRWWEVMTTVVDDMRTVQQGVGEDVRDRAVRIRAEATRRLAVFAAGAVLTLLIALLLWLYTFRSILRPLRRLTDEAHEAAERKLPVAVARIQAAEDPGGVVLDAARSGLAGRGDEFAEVAQALDHLQETAVRLAVEQAVMRRNTAESLANLGRRNQNLVRRQLRFISALEREEADPNQLANLFELDHLATRMRRNAESLLVLVGEHSPRRWSGAIAVGDVLRSAFAEVEDYRRVILRRVDEAAVKGAAAAEISHLLAELVENALSCSPPDQEVEVQARAAPNGEYHIAIVDQGVGMTPEAMATANARLRGEQSFLVAPTRDLGHYVVGRLAERLGVKVWLHDSPLNGVTARVVLPAKLLEPAPQEPAPVPVGVGASAPSVAGQTGPQPVAAPPSGTAREPAGTTRNGLAKRGERTLRRPQRPAPAPPNDPPARRSPAEVQSMLNTFRSGYHRTDRDGSNGGDR